MSHLVHRQRLNLVDPNLAKGQDRIVEDHIPIRMRKLRGLEPTLLQDPVKASKCMFKQTIRGVINPAAFCVDQSKPRK